MRPSWLWKHFGATSAGLFYSRTPTGNPSRPLKAERQRPKKVKCTLKARTARIPLARRAVSPHHRKPVRDPAGLTPQGHQKRESKQRDFDATPKLARATRTPTDFKGLVFIGSFPSVEARRAQLSVERLVPHPVFGRFEATHGIFLDDRGEIAPLTVAIYEEDRSDEHMTLGFNRARVKHHPGF